MGCTRGALSLSSTYDRSHARGIAGADRWASASDTHDLAARRVDEDEGVRADAE